jgi:Kef-type K+ transport system membrane component KefB/nucleotide-binding universal stress UspA family protein
MDLIFNWVPDSPLVGFTLLLLISLTIPPIFEKLRLPGLVGLLVAGVCLGPYGLKILDPETDTMTLLSDIGKIYLMFVAGLEIDLADFRRQRNRSLGFGLSTFVVPMIAGTLIGRVFGFGWNPSILIGSLLASHTLLGYPIVNRLGLASNEAVTVTIGATIFTDVSALLVLAICVSIHAGEFSIASLAFQLISLAIYSVIVLYGFRWAGKEYFRRTGDQESNQFLFVLLAVFLASVGAQVINIDKIVGAFLAGLAVNDVVGHGPVEEKVVFVGSALFIPFFFVDMGLLVNLPTFVKSLTTELGLTIAIVVGLIASKFIAAFVIKWIYHYNWNECLTMWSLSLPQVAATLAAAQAGFSAGILNDAVFNTIIVLMVVTSLLGPLITDRFARKLPLPKAPLETQEMVWGMPRENVALNTLQSDVQQTNDFTVVIPISNPKTERYLIEMAALIARHESGKVIPLSITKAHVHLDNPGFTFRLKQSKRLLKRAIRVSQEFEVPAKPLIRIDDDIAQGISRTAREQDAKLIIMGWSPNTSIQARLLGNVIDSVFWSAHCPVAVMRLLEEPINIHQILVPVKILSPEALRIILFAQLFADTNQAKITFLHVCSRKTPDQEVAEFESELQKVVSHSFPQVEFEIQILRQDKVADAIIKTALSHDLVILRSMRRRTVAGLAVSDVTNQVLGALRCSMVLFGEPNRSHE